MQHSNTTYLLIVRHQSLLPQYLCIYAHSLRLLSYHIIATERDKLKTFTLCIYAHRWELRGEKKFAHGRERERKVTSTFMCCRVAYKFFYWRRRSESKSMTYESTTKNSTFISTFLLNFVLALRTNACVLSTHFSSLPSLCINLSRRLFFFCCVHTYVRPLSHKIMDMMIVAKRSFIVRRWWWWLRNAYARKHNFFGSFNVNTFNFMRTWGS